MSQQVESGRPVNLELMFRYAIPAFCILNGLIISGLALARWYPHILSTKLYTFEKFTVIFLIICLGSLTALSRRGFKGLQPGIMLVNVSLTIFLLCLLAVQATCSFFPALIPNALIRFQPELDPTLAAQKAGMLEYLEHSPWVKFRPNAYVRSVGDRGGDFVYGWKTDHLGFKNSEDIAATFDAIAIGDSFVEGMGVAIEDTWSSILTRNGVATYNLGVQGYAPQQITGSLREFGLKIPSQYVFFGYTPGFEDRTLNFEDEARFKKERRFTGGIESINTYMNEQRAKGKVFGVLNGFIDLIIYGTVKPWIQNLRNPAAGRDKLAHIRAQISEATGPAAPRFDASSRQWQLTLEAIEAARDLTEAAGRRFIVVLFHTRNLVYFERLTGQPAHPGHYELDIAEALVSHCKARGIEVIETLGEFQSYVNALPEPPAEQRWPYFSVDGHMNQTGQALLAEVIKAHLERID